MRPGEDQVSGADGGNAAEELKMSQDASEA